MWIHFLFFFSGKQVTYTGYHSLFKDSFTRPVYLYLGSKKMTIINISDGLLHLSFNSWSIPFLMPSQSRLRLQFQKHREASSPRNMPETLLYIYSFYECWSLMRAASKNSLEWLFLNNLLLREVQLNATISIPLSMFVHHSRKKQQTGQH